MSYFYKESAFISSWWLRPRVLGMANGGERNPKKARKKERPPLPGRTDIFNHLWGQKGLKNQRLGGIRSGRL